MADQPRTGFPIGRPDTEAQAPQEPSQTTQRSSSPGGFPGMTPAANQTAVRSAAAPAHANVPAPAPIPRHAPPPSTPAAAARPEKSRRNGGDSLWERVRFEVTDAITSGALSERLIRGCAAVEAPITTGRRVVVLGTAGGAGTTTVTAVLAKLLGSIRQEPIMALDATDQAGDLLRYLGAPAPAAMSALIRNFQTRPVRSLPEATTNAAACGNQVFAADRHDVPAVADSPINPREWTDVSSTLSRFMAVTLVDAGNAPLSRHAAALLETAHAVVLVTPPGDHAPAKLASIQATLTGAFPQVQQLEVTVRSRDSQERRLADRVLPFDRHLAGGGALQLSRLGSRTRIAATEIAGMALLAANRA
ncbi:hypothetical protein ACFVTE_14095 [Arthrobacter sp. NPDC058097]|uniref:hypothetical protein n=1 Tax=Arthrobacter sp. NPDC058097 TaxID=3346340 RepID=UPI0036DAF841